MLWSVHGDGRRVRDGEMIAPNERLSWPLTIGFGVQHVAAMFGATALVPAMVGLPVATTLLFSGIGTLLFLVVTKNRVPSYLASSFAFVAPLMAAQQHGIPAQLGAVLAAGAILVVVGVAIKALGVRLLESALPPVVSGGLVLLAGLSLAPRATQPFEGQPVIAVVTLGTVLLCLVLSRGLLARVAVLVGALAGWLVAFAVGGIERARLLALVDAPWFGLPELHPPELQPSVMVLAVPAVIVLLAETLAHVKAVGTATGRDLDGSIGDALIANGLSTAVAGAGGGTGTSTYPANTGVMVATRVFSTASCAVAAMLAIAVAFSPKVIALINTMPAGVVGGLTLVLYGMVALLGVRIWMQHRVDLTDPLTLLVAGAALVAGFGDLTISLDGRITLPGMAWGAMVIVLLHPIVRWLRRLRPS